MSVNLEVWFDFASTYSYLSIMRIESLVRDSDVRIVWRPFLLGPVFRSLGWSTSPFLLQKEKSAYMWLDVARQCRKLGLLWQRPSEFPRSSLLASRVALLGCDETWLTPFIQQVSMANFAHDQDVGSERVIREVLARLRLPADALLSAAQSEDNKLQLRLATEEARQRGVFGAPTFFVGAEMFWGNDRLDDAVDLACGRVVKM